MDMARDPLRQRYKFEGFHLVGQSGGGRLVFGLAEMRRTVRPWDCGLSQRAGDDAGCRGAQADRRMARSARRRRLRTWPDAGMISRGEHGASQKISLCNAARFSYPGLIH